MPCVIFTDTIYVEDKSWKKQLGKNTVLHLHQFFDICDASKVIAPTGLSDHNFVLWVLQKYKSTKKLKEIQIRLGNNRASSFW